MRKLGIRKVNDHKPNTNEVEKIHGIGYSPVLKTGKLNNYT